jgi:lysylphosphatidylglycerol synthetase-like protein (DUF2156 family)
MLLFFAWNPQLFLGEAAVPKRSYLLLIVLSMLCVAYLASGWKWGLECQGLRYTAIVSATNVFWIILLMLGFWRSWKSKELSFGASLLLQWLMFAWLAWYAFPYMGEFI